jgi:hypothetical protein
MEMTISDYIKIIKNWLHKGTDGLTNTRLGYMEGWFHKTDKEAFETAINIMNKYQKIDEIYKNWSYGEDSCDCMKDIERVILDGNNT